MSTDEPVTHESIAERNRAGVELQSAGRAAEALAFAAETLRLAAEHLPEHDVERAKAVFNFAAIHAQVGDPAKSLDYLRRGLGAIRAAVGEQHPFYGRALSTYAGFLSSAGKGVEAEYFLVKALAVFAAAPEAGEHLGRTAWELAELHRAMAEQERAEAASAQEPDVSAKVGAAHFKRSLQGRSMRAELDILPPEVREFAEKNLEGASAAIGAMSTHALAQAIVERRGKRGEPFALLLRGFEGEAYDYIIRSPMRMTNDPDSFSVVSPSNRPGKVELALGPALAGKLSALTVANPASLDPGQVSQGALLPRYILAQNWLDVVRSLIRVAHLIVVDCLGLNEGLRMELETIVQCGKVDSTVVMLHRDGAAELAEMDAVAEMMADVAGGTLEPRPPREWVTREHTVVAPFKRVGYAEDLSAETLASSELFADLLAAVPLVRSATRLGQGGTALIEAGQIEDGARYLQTALFMAQGVPGWAERSTVLFNLGLVLLNTGQLQEAFQLLGECRATAAAAGDASGEGRALSALGEVYAAAGQGAEAEEAFLASLPPLEAAGGQKDLARALRLLSETCRARGEEAKAEAAAAELARLEAEGSWSRSRAGSEFNALFPPPPEASGADRR